MTYDAAAVKDLVPKLASKIGNNQAVYLTDKVLANVFFLLFFVCERDHLISSLYDDLIILIKELNQKGLENLFSCLYLVIFV